MGFSSIKRQRLKRQRGMAMVEVTSTLLLTGAAATVVLSQQDQHEALAQTTMLESTVAGFTSGLQLHQAKWAVTSGSYGGALKSTALGMPSGLDHKSDASQADCDAIWSHLLMAQPQLQIAPERYWQSLPAQERCEYRYHHHKLPTLSFFYHTQTGELAFE